MGRPINFTEKLLLRAALAKDMDTSRLDHLKRQKEKMGKAKVSDRQIMDAVAHVQHEKARAWRSRFGPDSTPFIGFRRAEIQDKVEFMFDVSYSKSGFRNRLKKLVEKDRLSKFRISDRIVYYHNNQNPNNYGY